MRFEQIKDIADHSAFARFRAFNSAEVEIYSTDTCEIFCYTNSSMYSNIGLSNRHKL